MYARAGLLAIVFLGGCEIIDDGRDLIGDLTNPLVTQALVLGVTLPDDAPDVDLPPEYGEGAGATVFLADAASVADLENAPITGASITLDGTAVTEIGEGGYGLQPGEKAYVQDGTWDLNVEIGGDLATAAIDLPPAPQTDLPESHQPNTALTVNITGQFDGAFVVVLDDEGEVVYDNRPADIKGLYDLTRGEAPTEVVIGAEAFPEVGVYLVGVAGIRTTTGREDLEGMNTLLSTMMAGQMVMEPVAVAP